jgi:[calcium/calmodulin-dependent protein kinase] kinase
LQVRLCKDRTTDNLYAIKIISKDMLKKRKGGNTKETYFEDIRREIAIMKKLQHPNVLRLYEVLDDPNVSDRTQDRAINSSISCFFFLLHER